MASANLIETFNMTLPPEGPGALPVTLTFDGSNDEQEIDLTQPINDGVVSYISGVLVDALDATGGDFEIEIQTIGQRIRVVSGAFASYPLISPNPPKFVARALDGFTGNVRLLFVNFPIWAARSNDGTGGGSTSGPAITDYSLDLAGGSETLFAAGEAGRYLFVYNPTGNSPIQINLAGADATVSGIPIAAGGSYELADGVSGAVTISGAIGESVTVFGGA